VLLSFQISLASSLSNKNLLCSIEIDLEYLLPLMNSSIVTVSLSDWAGLVRFQYCTTVLLPRGCRPAECASLNLS
jgi:hypothetical protein